MLDTGRTIPSIVITQVSFIDDYQMLWEYYCFTEELYEQLITTDNEYLINNLNKLSLTGACNGNKSKLDYFQRFSIDFFRKAIYTNCISMLEKIFREICVVVAKEKKVDNEKLSLKRFTIKKGFDFLERTLEGSVYKEIENYNLIESFVELRNCIVHRDSSLTPEQFDQILYKKDGIKAEDEFVEFIYNYNHVRRTRGKIFLEAKCIIDVISNTELFLDNLCERIKHAVHDTQYKEVYEIMEKMKRNHNK